MIILEKLAIYNHLIFNFCLEILEVLHIVYNQWGRLLLGLDLNFTILRFTFAINSHSINSMSILYMIKGLLSLQVCFL